MRSYNGSARVAVAVFVLGAFASACGDDGDDGGDWAETDAAPESSFIPGFAPPPPADGEIQLISPPVLGVAPGTDVTYCHYIDYRFPEETDIVDYHGYQSALGAHHVLLYAVQNPQPAGTHECNEDDMFNARFLAVGGAEAPPAQLPTGVVFRVPAQKQLMIQTHWINATESPIDGQGAFTLKVTPPSADVETAQLFSIADTDFSLPIGVGSTSVECEIQERLSFFSLGGHMHEWGTHVSITFTPAGGAPEVIYDHGWVAEDQFNPPQNLYTTEDPFVVRPGDRIRIDCEYMNDTGAPLPFPSEMCVFFSYAYPATQQIDCTDGNWPSP